MNFDRGTTVYDPADYRPVLERMGLLGADEAFSLEPLTGGVSSVILKIVTGRRLFCLKKALAKLKVAKDWYAPVDRVFSEINWLTRVGAFAPTAAPKVIGIDRESGSFAMDFLPADDFANWKAQLLEGRVDLDLATMVGRTLGRIHAHTAFDPQVAGEFANDATFYALRLEPYLVETARVHASLSRTITGIMERTRDTRHVLVHGDVSPKNILAGRNGPVFIDAECACFGDPAFDLAFCLNHFLLKAAHMNGHAEEFLAAFSRLADAYLRETDWESKDAAEGRTATLLPCLTLARVDGKSPVEYLSETRRAQVRAAAVRLIEAQAPRLADIVQFWSEANFDGCH